MMMSRAQTNAKTAGLKIPKDSMDVLMAKLRGIKAEKRRKRQCLGGASVK